MKSGLELLKTYKAYIGKTEAPQVFHRWSFLVVLSAALGRNVHADLNGMIFYPPEFVMLMGSPGTRKSTAIGQARRLLELSGYNRFAATQTSKEQFYIDLGAFATADLFGHARCLVAADEFNNFIGEKNSGFVAGLMKLYDMEDTFSARSKNGKSSDVSFPTVSLLGGNTHAGFSAAFSPSIMHNGFLSRMLLIHGEPSGVKLAFGGEKDKALQASLADHLRAISENLSGPIRFTPGSLKALETIYETWEPLEDSRFDSYGPRRYTHLLKLCLNLTCGAGSMLLTEDEVVLANTILASAEESYPKALGEFGKSKYAEEAGMIMSELYRAKSALSTAQMMEKVQTNVDKYDTFREILTMLVMSKKVIQVEGGFMATPVYRKRMEYVDFDLLKEI